MGKDNESEKELKNLNTKRKWNKVLFEITTFCNMHCPFCFNDSSAEKNEYMTFDAFKVMVDKIKDKGISIELSGGEPFTHPDIDKIIDYLIKCKMSFSINTNGMLINDAIIEKIINYKSGSIQFSLDGVDSATDDVVRCKGHFDKIHSLMILLNEKGFNNGVLRMVINRLNYNQIEEYFYFALKYNFIPTYAFLVKSGRAQGNWDNLCIDDSMKYDARMKIIKLIEANKDYIVQKRSEKFFYKLKYMNISYVNECGFNNADCGFTPSIHVDGSAQPCEGLFQSEFCIGNLLEKEIEEIYSSDNILVKKLISKAQRRRKYLDENTCGQCPINKMCGKGCLAEAYNEGDFYGKPLWCDIRKRDFLDNILKQKGDNSQQKGNAKV